MGRVARGFLTSLILCAACSGGALQASPPAVPQLPAAGSSGHLGADQAGASGSSKEPVLPADVTTMPQPIAAPPSYRGTRGSDAACATPFRTTGYAPADAKRHPLFLYFAGTEFVSADQSSKYDSQAAAKVTEAMARRGFVALAVEYDNLVGSILTNKLPCLYDKKATDSLIVKACEHTGVDCNLGVATWGHSQGALLAHAAAISDPRVKAVWTTGYAGNEVAGLSVNRLRVVNAEGDTMNGSVATLNKAAGFSSADCPDDGRDQCLRDDGSGWIVVRKAQCKTTSADHCWFDKRSCGDNAETLETNWIERSSNAAFALEANADWVSATVARP